MKSAATLSKDVGKKAACMALNISRSTFYRQMVNNPKPVKETERPAPPLALSDVEQKQVLDVLNSKRFWDQTPYEVYATLLDEATYLCSVRTMYRILSKHNQVKERRKHIIRTHYKKPELLATGPKQVWSWDITKLKGPQKWTYYYLYVILDIFSRYVVGWMVAHRESAALAKNLIQQTCEKQKISQGQLLIHADRGPSMTSKSVAYLLADLGVTKTHSRPHVSNDNPYSESQFKTLKYHPEFPGRFGSIQDAKGFCRNFFTWYNTDHKHSGLGFVTLEQVHYGLAEEVLNNRANVLQSAFEKHQNRFKGKMPKPLPLPEAAWINRPQNLAKNDENSLAFNAVQIKFSIQKEVTGQRQPSVLGMDYQARPTNSYGKRDSFAPRQKDYSSTS